MIMVYIIFLLALIFVRGFAGYDSRRQKGKYIVIKNEILSRLLLDKMMMFEKSYRLKKDRNKMSFVGLVYYIAAFIVFIISVVFTLVPDIPSEPWVFQSVKFALLADSLNDKIVVIAITSILAAVFSYLSISIVKMTKDTKPTWLKIFVWVIACLMILVSSFPCIYMIVDLIVSLL